jgi:GrpB-like predicted nucleotidyltransferase (UPF0157 family)
VAESAAAAAREHSERIHERLPGIEVRHTGGTSVPGVLTTGDVDLQVRADRRSFEQARDVLCELYEPHCRDVWHSEGAFFVAAATQPPVEIALTAIGSLDDLHHGEAWDRIAADPDLIERYNDMKRASAASSTAEYNAAKRAFFFENFQL